MTQTLDVPWQRLDARMLLVHPLQEALRPWFLPILVGLYLGSRQGGGINPLFALAFLALDGVLRWLTTTYRIGPDAVELQHGLLRRTSLTIPRDRIRSVDVEAGVAHRMLGLAVLHVGTGARAGQGEQLRLNALDARLVPGLRTSLLSRAVQGSSETTTATDIAQWRPSWVRYAPFTLTGLVWIAFVLQVAQELGGVDAVLEHDRVAAFVDAVGGRNLLADVVVATFLIVLLSSLTACGVYLIGWYGLRVEDDGSTLHSSRGLLTRRQVTLEKSRVRGATLKDPLLLRAARGAALDAIVVGTRQQNAALLPQAPRTQAQRLMAYLLRSDDLVSMPLTRHGAAATRRRFTRAQLPVAVVASGVAVTEARLNVPWQVWAGVIAAAVLSIPLALDRARNLGHAARPGWLVTRAGSLNRHRDCVQSAGVVCWVVRQSLFQRRAGVATVVAATAAGRGSYAVVDVPAERAWAVVEAASPGAGDIWLTPEV